MKSIYSDLELCGGNYVLCNGRRRPYCFSWDYLAKWHFFCNFNFSQILQLRKFKANIVYYEMHILCLAFVRSSVMRVLQINSDVWQKYISTSKCTILTTIIRAKITCGLIIIIIIIMTSPSYIMPRTWHQTGTCI